MTIDEIRALVSAATPGPWYCHYGSDSVCQCRSVVGMHGGFGSLAQISVDNGLRISEGGNDAPDESQAKGNARLMAATPAIAAFAIDQAEQLAAAHAEIERLRAALAAIRKLNTAEPGGPDQVWVHSGLIDQEIFAALKEPKP